MTPRAGHRAMLVSSTSSQKPGQRAMGHVLHAMVMEIVLTPAGGEPGAGRARRHVQSVVDDFLKQLTNQHEAVQEVSSRVQAHRPAAFRISPPNQPTAGARIHSHSIPSAATDGISGDWGKASAARRASLAVRGTQVQRERARCLRRRELRTHNMRSVYGSAQTEWLSQCSNDMIEG